MNNPSRRPQPLAETDLHYRQSLIALAGLFTVLLAVTAMSLMLGSAAWVTAVAAGGTLTTAVAAFFRTLSLIGRRG